MFDNDERDTLCFPVDRWTHGEYREARGQVGALPETEDAGREKNQHFGRFSEELFARFYQPTLKATESTGWAEWARKLHDAAGELPEFERLQQRSRNDSLFSGVATSEFNRALHDQIPKAPDALKNAERLRSRAEMLEDMARDFNSPEAAERAAETNGAASQADAVGEHYAKKIDDSAIRQALRTAVASANEKLDEVERAMFAFGGGAGRESIAHGRGLIDPSLRVELAQRLAGDDKLRKVLDIAGRLINLAAGLQANKANPGRDEVVDVELGDDLERILPSQLVTLAHPMTEPIFFRNFTEKRCLQTKLRGKEKKAKGPIVFCVDVSISMRKDSRIAWAMALALAFATIAQKQKRTFGIVLFEGVVVDSQLFRKPDPRRLMDLISHGADGTATAFDPPITEGQRMITDEKLDDADLVFLTDGVANLSDEVADGWERQRKREGIRAFAIAIGTESGNHNLKRIADKIYNLADVTGAATDEAERDLLSL